MKTTMQIYGLFRFLSRAIMLNYVFTTYNKTKGAFLLEKDAFSMIY